MHRVRCGSGNELIRATWMRRPYICGDCRKDSSVIIATVLCASMMALSSQAIAFYLYCTNLKSISSMKSHRVLGMTR